MNDSEAAVHNSAASVLSAGQNPMAAVNNPHLRSVMKKRC